MDIPNMECEKHPGFTMTFVCMTCNATLVCMDCMTDNLHHGNMFCKPNTISTDVKANLTLKIDTDCRLEAALESDLNEMRTLKSQHENKQMETVTSINTQREILIKAVNEMADSFISQNETQNERNYVAIQDAIDDISGKLENVRQHRKDAIRILGETDELTMAQDSLKLTDVESQSKPFTGLTSVEFTHGKVINDQLKLMFGCTVTAAAGKELPALCGAHENDYLEIVPGDTDTDTASQMNEPAISLGAQEVVYDYDYLEFMSGDKDTASRMNEPAISLGAQEVVYDTISMSASSDVVGIVHHQEKRLVLQSSFKHSRFSYVSSMCNAADGKSWVKCHGGREITLLNKHGQGAKTVKLNYSVRGMTITNDNTMFVCGVEERDIKQVELSTDKINSVFSTGKLYPQYVCTTQNGDLYVTLVDKHDYHITAQSRRTLVRYSEKGQEKSRAQYDSRGDVLFVWPCRVRICNAGDVIGVRNDTGKQTNHLVLMNTENLTLRLRYLGNGKVVSGEKKFDITNNTKDTSYRLNDFIFDSFDNIITCEVTNRCVQLLSKYCIPLRSLLTTLACAPMTITMNGDELWLGFGDGTLKVYELQVHATSTSGTNTCSIVNVTMAGLEVSEDEMWDVVLGGNVSQIEAWVRDGLDLARWRSKIGDNIYHYCVIHSSCYGALCVAESVPRLCHTYATLLTQPNDRGQTPFVHACYTSSGHDLAMMEFLIHHNPSINYDRLLSSTLSDQSIIRYLVWRLKNSSGLPKEISRLQNTHILSFIETVEGMDNLSAKRYLMSVQEQAEKSCNIRLIFLGYQGVGKTSLLLRLTGQDLSNLESTNQIDVYHNLVIADMETKTRRLLPKKQEHDVTRSRLRDVIIDSVSSYHDKGSRKTVKDPKTNNITSQRSENSTSEQSNAMKEEPEVELRSEAGAVLTVSDITTVGSAKSRVYVSMFDFGGEIMFSNFQHIFLNTNSVILLCFSLHTIFEEDKILDRVFFWLKFLSTFAPCDKKYCPPVVLIGTHLDKVPQEERIDIKDRVKTQLLMEPTHATAYQRHVLAFEVVNNIPEVTERVSKSGNISADELRQNVIENQQQHDLIWERIFEAAKYQSHWNQILPAKWLLLERDLMILKSQGKKIITLSEVNIRAKQLSVPLEDVDVKAMLSYLHETRSILCFQLDHPDDKVILDIQFIIEAFRLIVTDLKFHKRKTNIDAAVQHEYGNSRLTMAFIRAVWEQKSEFHGMTDTLLFFLERLELLVKPLPIEGEMTVDYFIVPYLLDESDPTEIRKLLHDQVKRSTLCFDFQGRFIPPAVYKKILASCIHRFSVLTKTGGGVEMYLQQGLACFVLSPRWKLILHCNDSIMKITLFSDTIISIEAGDGFNIRCIMEEIIATTLDRNQQGHLKFRYSLSSDFEVTMNEEMIPVDITTETVPSVGTEAAVWCRVQNQTKQTLEPSILDTIPSSRELIHIAKNIGTNYSMFFVELGLDTRQVERIRLQHERRRDFLSIWTTILLAWKDKLGPRATLRHVQKSMTFCGFDSTDLLHTIETLRKPGKVDNADDVKIPSNYRPQANELSDISMLILKAYFIVFIELGVTKSYIDLVEMEEPNPISMITQLLSHWMDTQTEANAQQLYLALQECETNSCCDFIEMMRKRIQP